MATIPLLLLLSLAAGLSIFLGALLGRYAHNNDKALSANLEHGILAFGGGALIGAVGLVLVPDGLDILPVWLAAGSFILGGYAFLWLDCWLHQRGTPVSQLVAMMSDFIPEAIVLGAVITMDPKMAIFLAVIIAAQNLPEGFAAYREIRNSDNQDHILPRHPLKFMALCILVGPLAALFGLYVCSRMDLTLGLLMTFCGGGILYLVFRDIAPAANLEKSWYPPFGAVLGFAVGLIGFGIIH